MLSQLELFEKDIEVLNGSIPFLLNFSLAQGYRFEIYFENNVVKAKQIGTESVTSIGINAPYTLPQIFDLVWKYIERFAQEQKFTENPGLVFSTRSLFIQWEDISSTTTIVIENSKNDTCRILFDQLDKTVYKTNSHQEDIDCVATLPDVLGLIKKYYK